MSDGFHFLRLEQRLARLFKFLLSFPSLGNISCDFHKSNNGAVISVNSIEHDVRPKPRAIFADSPSLIFKAPIARSSFKSALGRTSGPIGSA